MARKGLFDIPVLGFYIKQFSIPVSRDRTSLSNIKEPVKRLRKGELLVIFPEGKRSETGELMEGKRGIGMIARLGNAVIIPTLITGTNKALPVDSKWIKRAKIKVVFDKPVFLSSTGEKTGHVAEEITRDIMHRIQELKEQYANNSR
jgi:1-acyl-sn-glycerol-3-phosphate acyltransferase